VLGRSAALVFRPGDAHSNKEWIWRRDDYQALFGGAPQEALRLESTPFYLYLSGARRRIAEELPNAKLIIILRDPIDRRIPIGCTYG